MALIVKTPTLTKEYKQNGTENYPKYNGQNVSKINVIKNGVTTTVWEFKKGAVAGRIENYSGNFIRQNAGPQTSEFKFSIQHPNFKNEYTPLLSRIKATLNYYNAIDNKTNEATIDISSTPASGSLSQTIKGYDDGNGLIRYIRFSVQTSLLNGGQLDFWLYVDKSNYGQIIDNNASLSIQYLDYEYYPT